MINYEEVISFLERVDANSEEVQNFLKSFDTYNRTGEWQTAYQVFTSGWLSIDGVMLMRPENAFDADFRVYVYATTERSLRELLLAFPRQVVGLFRMPDKWIGERILSMFECESVKIDSKGYFRGIKRDSEGKLEQRAVAKRSDEIATHYRKLATLKGKIDNSAFIVEGELLVDRAVKDGQPVNSVLYTNSYVSTNDGKALLKQIIQQNVSCYMVNDGVMGSVTTTRPVPSIVASVHLNYPEFLSKSGDINFHFSRQCILLIAENVSNPDNLGMTLRTADAAGVSGVLICGDGASPFHKNCVRASRGAVGRLPMFYTNHTVRTIEELKASGWYVVGATAGADTGLYGLTAKSPTAIVVGNENTGLSAEVREVCTELVRIPMAAGQSSLNVGVAAGVMLYEFVRQKFK